MSLRFTRQHHQALSNRLDANQRQQATRGLAQSAAQFYGQPVVRANWESASERKAIDASVRRRVDRMCEEEERAAEERRQSERERIAEERRRYEEQLTSQVETEAQRFGRMKLRADMLRTERLAAERQLAEEKRQQQIREQSERVRSVDSKLLLQNVYATREQQLQEQATMREEEREREAFYARQWNDDRLRKEAREEADKAHRRQLNAQQKAVLDEQMAELERKKSEAAQIDAELAVVRKEEEAERRAEEQARERKRMEQQRARRHELDQANEVERARRARRERELAEMDEGRIARAVAEMDEEQHEGRERKERFRREQERYLAFVREMREQERERERAVDALAREENGRLWARRSAVWEAEREARRRLMDEVMRVRREQIAGKRAVLEERRRAVEGEREALATHLEEWGRLEAERERERKEEGRAYGSALVEQMRAERERVERERRVREAEERERTQRETEQEMRVGREVERGGVLRSHRVTQSDWRSNGEAPWNRY